jgi:hypothetical protein
MMIDSVKDAFKACYERECDEMRGCINALVPFD